MGATTTGAPSSINPAMVIAVRMERSSTVLDPPNCLAMVLKPWPWDPWREIDTGLVVSHFYNILDQHEQPIFRQSISRYRLITLLFEEFRVVVFGECGKMATLVAPHSADPFADAEALRKACEGWGTDEKGVIEVIGHRTYAQLKLIKEAYQQNYGEDLIRRLEKELSGDFEKAVYRWMHEPLDREAILANVALKKGDYKVIVELACIPSSEELLGLRRAYQARYKHSLEEDVASHTSGDVRRLLLHLVSAYRYETDETDAKVAQKEAEVLHKAIKDKQYNHDEVLRIVATRSKAQLIATFFRYNDVYDISITKHMAVNRDDEYGQLLEAAIECIRSPLEYLESVVRGATLKKGADEDGLTRVIVTRAERDLGQIKELFYKRNSVTLEHAVEKVTSGDYRRFLLTLLGAEHH